MFENIQKDIIWNHQHSDTAKAINRMHGKVWVPEDPVFKAESPGVKPWRPPGYKPARGRSPVQTRFKRQPETVKKDQDAWHLRELGYSYQEIADVMGYSDRSVAFRAVARAQRDQCRDNKATQVAPLPDSSRPARFGRARGRAFPPVRP